MLAAAAMIVFAVACGSKKKDLSQMTAPEIAKEMVKAAEADDIDAFKAAFEAMEALGDNAASDAAMESLSESEKMTLVLYTFAHMEEISGEKFDFDSDDSSAEIEWDQDAEEALEDIICED